MLLFNAVLSFRAQTINDIDHKYLTDLNNPDGTGLVHQKKLHRHLVLVEQRHHHDQLQTFNQIQYEDSTLQKVSAPTDRHVRKLADHASRLLLGQVKNKEGAQLEARNH